MRMKNRIGERYGSLLVTELTDRIKHPNGKVSIRWKCKCDCGNEINVIGNNLQNGHTKSCGCLQTNSPNALKHGKRNSRLYHIWINMKQRCYNSNTNDFKNYGERGIQVCAEWRGDFTAFERWAMNNGYSDSLTLDRIDNDGNYEPNNCRWVTRLIQRHNQRRLNDWIKLYKAYESEDKNE